MTILEAAEILDEHAKAGVAYWNKRLQIALHIASDVLRKVDAIQNIDVDQPEEITE